MLGSMGIKGGIVLYHIGYGTTLGCLIISGVKCCYQPRFWLIGVGWITKPHCDQICDMDTLACIVGVLIVVGGREVLSSSFISRFNLSSTKGQFWIHVQPIDNMHMLMQFQQ
jgi:hypothetical protein